MKLKILVRQKLVIKKSKVQILALLTPNIVITLALVLAAPNKTYICTKIADENNIIRKVFFKIIKITPLITSFCSKIIEKIFQNN